MVIALLPAELARWDGAGGDLLALPVFEDVRPLRGPAGLADWRLCGRLSQALVEERFRGEAGESLLLPGERLPWREVMLFGAGAAVGFSEERCRDVLCGLFDRLGAAGRQEVTLSLPGRELGLLSAEIALASFREAAARATLRSVHLIDAGAGLRWIADALGIALPRGAPGHRASRPVDPGTPSLPGGRNSD